MYHLERVLHELEEEVDKKLENDQSTSRLQSAHAPSPATIRLSDRDSMVQNLPEDLQDPEELRLQADFWSSLPTRRDTPSPPLFGGRFTASPEVQMALITAASSESQLELTANRQSRSPSQRDREKSSTFKAHCYVACRSNSISSCNECLDRFIPWEPD